jgi:hypothetical protein
LALRRQGIDQAEQSKFRRVRFDHGNRCVGPESYPYAREFDFSGMPASDTVKIGRREVLCDRDLASEKLTNFIAKLYDVRDRGPTNSGHDG